MHKYKYCSTVVWTIIKMLTPCYCCSYAHAWAFPLSSLRAEREWASARTCFGWRTTAPLDMTYVGMTILPTTAPLSPTTAPLHIPVYTMTSGAQLSGSQTAPWKPHVVLSLKISRCNHCQKALESKAMKLKCCGVNYSKLIHDNKLIVERWVVVPSIPSIAKENSAEMF